MVIEKRLFTKKEKLLIFILGVILTGIPWWTTNYQGYSHKPYLTFISILLTAIYAAAIKYISKHGFWEIILVALSIHQIAFVLKIMIDYGEDKSNHNLAPFEMVLYLLIDFIICLLFVSIVSLITRFKSKKE